MKINFKNNTIAYTIVDGNPWFKAKEVASVLGYTNTTKAIIDHVDAEDKQRMDALTGVSQTPNDYNDRKAIFINEPSLYSLIMRSKMSEAKAFKQWVCSKVLPSIWKHGRYETPTAAIQIIQNPTGETKLHYKVKKHIGTTYPYVIISA
ncbi:MAG: Bro-N domain-containing protein, partial [Candidatus Fonsibacter sp.]